MQTIAATNSPLLAFNAGGPTVNRALVTVDGSQGLLPSYRPAGFNLGNDWSIYMRLRQANPQADYVLGIVPDEATTLAVIWNFAANKYEIFGTRDRFALTAPVTDGLFHEIEFIYANNVISGFLDGAPAGSVNSLNFTTSINNASSLAIGLVAGNRAWKGAYDRIKVRIGTEMVVDLRFDEASGDATNYGTNGGVMSFTGGVSRELVP